METELRASDIWNKNIENGINMKNKLGDQSQGYKLYLTAKKNQIEKYSTHYIISALQEMGFNLEYKDTTDNKDIPKFVKDNCKDTYAQLTNAILEAYNNSGQRIEVLEQLNLGTSLKSISNSCKLAKKLRIQNVHLLNAIVSNEIFKPIIDHSEQLRKLIKATKIQDIRVLLDHKLWLSKDSAANNKELYKTSINLYAKTNKQIDSEISEMTKLFQAME